MAVIDPRAMGERVAQARGRAGFTQAGLASAAGLDRSALAKIETGIRRVTALELARIAEALDERIEWFVMETPAAIVSHRNVRDPRAPSPGIDRLAERIAHNIEFVARHDRQFGPTGVPELTRPATMADAERRAADARELIGLDTATPFVDISARTTEIGILVFSMDIGTDSADAASILLADGAMALVNGELRIGRRRLAVVRELAHCLFADEYTVDWRIAEQDSGDDAWEARLDRFARAVLLPSAGITARWAELMSAHGDLRTAAVIAASAYQVDMSTLARRLSELDLIGQSDAGRIRNFRTTKADIVEFDLVIPQELEPPMLPRAYEQAVLRLYRSETISAARAVDLLLDTWNEADLPGLPPLPESAIWTFVS